MDNTENELKMANINIKFKTTVKDIMNFIEVIKLVSDEVILKINRNDPDKGINATMECLTVDPAHVSMVYIELLPDENLLSELEYVDFAIDTDRLKSFLKVLDNKDYIVIEKICDDDIYIKCNE